MSRRASPALTSLLLGALCLSGCGSVVHVAVGYPFALGTPYGGVGTDIYALLREDWQWWILAILDLPLSAVADTLVLPVDLGVLIYEAATRDDLPPEEERAPVLGQLEASLARVEGRPGGSGIPFEVLVNNRGREVASLTSASLSFSRAGVSARRVDSLASISAGGAARLRFELQVGPDVAPGRIAVECDLSGTEPGGDFALETATRATGELLLRGWAELAESARGGGVSRSAEPSEQPALALAPGGAVWLAWREGPNDAGEIYVSRWDGSGWSGAGQPPRARLSATPGESAEPQIAVAPEAPASPCVAWLERTAAGPQIYLRRWEAGAWAELGGSGSGAGLSGAGPAAGAAASRPALALGPQGPLVAWAHDLSGKRALRVRRWGGSAWEPLGSGPTSASPATGSHPELALDEGGNPVVAWVQTRGGSQGIHLARWRGSAWESLGEASPAQPRGPVAGPVEGLALALDERGRPWVAWSTTAAGRSQIFVRRREGQSWCDPSSTQHDLFSSGDSSARGLRLGFDPFGRALLIWEAGEGLHGARWTGSAWERLVGATSGSHEVSGTPGASRAPALAVDGCGRALVAWSDRSRDPAAGEIYLRRLCGATLTLRPNFGSEEVLERCSLQGDAALEPASQRVVLTPDAGSQRGGFFWRAPLRLSSFRARFSFRCEGSADGIALVFVRGPELLGERGDGLGVRGLEGFALTLPTYPSARIEFAPSQTLSPWASVSLPAAVRAQASTAEVWCDGSQLRVFLECEGAGLTRTLVLSHSLDELQREALRRFEGYLGFSAATGAESARHTLSAVEIEID